MDPHALIQLYLWKKRTLYLGELPHVSNLSPAASNLLVGLEKPFLIYDYKSGEETLTRSALIPAGTRFGANPLDQCMVHCYLDPLGEDLRRLSGLMQDTLGSSILINSRTECAQLRTFADIRANGADASAVYNTLMTDIFPPHSGDTMPGIDPRIMTVIEMIQNDPLSNESNDNLARRAGLTSHQLHRWFKRVTGVPVRRYRLWHRLFVTATLMSFGNNLTDAAHASGFSDSSHLNHTFRSMLGMTPSFVFQRSERLRIYTSQDDD